MKKILAMLFVLVLVASTGFAGNLANSLDSTKLSKNVEGAYWVNSDNSGYALSTLNTNGTKTYASGSYVSEIYYVDGKTQLSADPSTFSDSSDFDSYSEM